MVQSAAALFSLNVSQLSIYPRVFDGAIGIFFSPIIHASWTHLAANSFPLLTLGCLLSYAYPASFTKTLITVWITAGLGVWIFGRASFHLGASGVVSGLFYFIFFAAILRRDKKSIGTMFIAVMLFGSVMLGILPWDPKISFESHLFGALGGVISTIFFRNVDPKPQIKLYDWELEDEPDTELIGDSEEESNLESFIDQEMKSKTTKVENKSSANKPFSIKNDFL